jgi:hypothetical protein
MAAPGIAVIVAARRSDLARGIIGEAGRAVPRVLGRQNVPQRREPLDRVVAVDCTRPIAARQARPPAEVVKAECRQHARIGGWPHVHRTAVGSPVTRQS